MKKIIAILALTLCALHDCTAMLNPIRQNMGRFGQYARQYVPQAAQTCRTFASRASNLRPQNFGWLRNMQTYARNANLPSMRTAAVGLGGLGLGAAYLQRPELFASVKAEEKEKPTDILNDIRSQFDEITHRTHSNRELRTLQDKLRNLTSAMEQKQITAEDRKNFASIVNNILYQTKQYDESLEAKLKHYMKITTQEYNDAEMGITTFLHFAIRDDILLANATIRSSDIKPNQDIEIPGIYKRFFKENIGKENSALKTAFLKQIKRSKRMAQIEGDLGLDRILDAIAKEIEGKSSSWWWPF